MKQWLRIVADIELQSLPHCLTSLLASVASAVEATDSGRRTHYVLLQALIPGFTTPSVVVANVTATLLQNLPELVGVPVFVIPDNVIDTVSLVLTNLTAVPTLIRSAVDQVSWGGLV